ncbi:hypothetical protein D3875_03325 [Deinococcus cavernae]|uniref:Uncharacterized protein n=1 Tax=Deinococcus cavernae TaxID=2320857 RepID=A0A418VEV3_9DEIO|nr:hypothetical protein [Deinococcus cavernae]RJF74585.1 hypothetical protein D3875_03325 [Deinococcus cavernae]
MTEPIPTAAALSATNTESSAAQPALLNVGTQVAMLATFLFLATTTALAQTGGGGGGIDLSAITGLVCQLATQLKAPALLGAAGTVIVLVFGWNKLMGESNAFQGLKNGVIGAIIILAAGTIAQALFKGAC